MAELSDIDLIELISQFSQPSQEEDEFCAILGDLEKKVQSIDEIGKELTLKKLLCYRAHDYTPIYFSNEDFEFLGYHRQQKQNHLSRACALELLKADREVFIFTLLPFDESRPWKKWTLPHYLLCDYTLVHDKRNERLKIIHIRNADLHQALHFSTTPKEIAETHTIKRTIERPSFTDWSEFIHRALEDLKTSKKIMTKVVAARVHEVRVKNKCCPLSLFNQLNSNSRYHFYIENDALTFMGNTPECLLRVKDNEYEFDALAGTRARSEDPIEDERLHDELLASSKEQYEHDQVVRYITEGLNQFGEVIQGKSHVLKLKSLQHIKTPLTLKAFDQSPELLMELIERLHPTPAVCGMPKNEAMDFLRAHDPIDRGMYAGAIGMINQNYSELCVAIRSLLTDFSDSEDKKVLLFGGAGIVADSTAQSEWEETAHKIKSFSPFKDKHE